jgi:NTP pyrophosphatase (non-canonical NTP hydrolase)
MFLKILREKNIQRQREFDPQSVMTLSYRGNEFAGEAGELCNMIKKIERIRLQLSGTFDRDFDRLVLEARKEAADVLITLDLICADMMIDLEQATRDKFNESTDKFGLKTRMPAADSDLIADNISLRKALAAACDDLEADIEASRGNVLKRITDRDLAEVASYRSALVGSKA